MPAVDTNVLVRLLTRDDPAQAAAAEAFLAAGGRAWVCHVVLAETVWVLESVHRRSREQIAEAVAMLLDYEALVVDDAPVVAAALALFRRRGSVGFSDCLVLETARKAGQLPLGTFDRGLAALGAERL